MILGFLPFPVTLQRWYHASVVADDDASVPHPAAADGPPATTTASARGATWCYPAAAAAGTTTDVRISGSTPSWQYEGCATNTAKLHYSTYASAEKTIDLAETPQDSFSTIDDTVLLVKYHRSHCHIWWALDR